MAQTGNINPPSAAQNWGREESRAAQGEANAVGKGLNAMKNTLMTKRTKMLKSVGAGKPSPIPGKKAIPLPNSAPLPQPTPSMTPKK